MKNAIVKAALYSFLSVATFFQRTICTIAGLALLIAGLVNAMAAICHELNVRDGLVGETADDTSIDERAASINKFGTFWTTVDLLNGAGAGAGAVDSVEISRTHAATARCWFCKSQV